MKRFATVLLLLVSVVVAADVSNAVGQGAASVFGDVTKFGGGAVSTVMSGVGQGGSAVASGASQGNTGAQSGLCSGDATCRGEPTVSATNPNQSYNGGVGTIHSAGESAPGASLKSGAAVASTATSSSSKSIPSSVLILSATLAGTIGALAIFL
ncbi:hypothetical protein Malapachy_4278 [Malassezia pachydermatis]|uniref:Uncharacterized protein n=1 Tax=Malassezia pachydermatis TaxID=77020 RepID=A0A0M8MKA4_9BASI|nr:hypothetical protein Malapachy_4278 [Malassezia pachydermatis]KOS14176.1 hypothetical protein Malapachy_4278 [Malassezia pachydermatis]